MASVCTHAEEISRFLQGDGGEEAEAEVRGNTTFYFEEGRE